MGAGGGYQSEKGRGRGGEGKELVGRAFELRNMGSLRECNATSVG